MYSENYYTIDNLEEDFDLENCSKEEIDLLEKEILRKANNEEKELNFN